MYFVWKRVIWLRYSQECPIRTHYTCYLLPWSGDPWSGPIPAKPSCHRALFTYLDAHTRSSEATAIPVGPPPAPVPAAHMARRHRMIGSEQVPLQVTACCDRAVTVL